MTVRIVISGRGYSVADSLPKQLELASGGTLDDVLEKLAAALPAGEQMPASAMIAVSGRHVGTVGRHESPELADGDEVAIIMPVAGG